MYMLDVIKEKQNFKTYIIQLKEEQEKHTQPCFESVCLLTFIKIHLKKFSLQSFWVGSLQLLSGHDTLLFYGFPQKRKNSKRTPPCLIP